MIWRRFQGRLEIEWKLSTIAGYTELEKYILLKIIYCQNKLEEHGLTKSQLQIKDDAIKKLVRYYTREAGVRELRKTVSIYLSKSCENHCFW